MNLKTKLIIKGLATYIPGLRRVPSRGEMGGNISFRYCYSVWLRHLVLASGKNRMKIPETIAEIGPGASLGTGLAAMITGVNHYYAYDSVKAVDPRSDLEIFNNLIQLFLNEEEIPGPDEFPLVKPFLTSYKFPKQLLPTSYLKDMMRKERLDDIKRAIIGNSTNQSITIQYSAPFYNLENIPDNFFDLIFSQTALEYIPQITNFYRQANKLLKPSGVMSHQIDLTSIGFSEHWDGHWTYSNFVWKLIRGKNRCIINRSPHSFHIDALRDAGFNIIHDMRRTNKPNFSRDELAKPFRKLADDDLCTTGMYILAIKNV